MTHGKLASVPTGYARGGAHRFDKAGR